MVQKNDLSLWAWGYNVDGALGITLPNQKKNSAVPVQIPFEWPQLDQWDEIISLNLNGKSLFFATNKPYLTVKQEAMVPALSFAKQLGWTASLSGGTLKLSDKSATLTVTKSGMTSSNGIPLSAKAAAHFTNGEVFVPLRALAETFNLTTGYYSSVKTMGIYKSDFQAQDQLDVYGSLKRTGGLPKNAAEYPYVLAGVPNTLYEKALPKVEEKGRALNAAQLYRSKASGLPIELTVWDYGRFANEISGYYQILLNADYRTIDLKWATALESHAGGGTSELGGRPSRVVKMESYVNWIKKNKVIIQGNVHPEPSMVSYRNGLLYMRTYFQYQIVQASAADYLKLRKDRIVQLISAPTGKSVAGNYAMYVDVPLIASVNYDVENFWYNWSDALKVDTRADDIMPTPWDHMFTVLMKPD